MDVAVPQITLSIVTPSYNQGHFLEETVRSVLSQEGDFYIDYIVMDGGSSDNSVDILKKYEELLHSGNWKTSCLGINFRWFSEKDNGQSHAINKGFKIAEGEVLAWINSDDTFIENAFATVMGHFLTHPGDDFLYGDGDVIDENGTLQWEWLSRQYDYNLMKSFHFLWNDFTNYIMQQATFWRRSVLDKIGMIDESFHYAMDVEYWVRAGSSNLRLVHIPKKLGRFRMITGTKSLSSPTVFWPDMLEIFRRYNGADKMKPFLALFYYNLAKYDDFNIGNAPEGSRIIFNRWQNVAGEEKNVLESQAKRGFALSCLLSINGAYNNGNKQATASIANKIRNDFPGLMMHPLFIFYVIKCIIGPNLSSRLTRWIQAGINKYRQIRYQARYFKNPSSI